MKNNFPALLFFVICSSCANPKNENPIPENKIISQMLQSQLGAFEKGKIIDEKRFEFIYPKVFKFHNSVQQIIEKYNSDNSKFQECSGELRIEMESVSKDCNLYFADIYELSDSLEQNNFLNDAKLLEYMT